MCICDPNKRTPWCGAPGCEMPPQNNKTPGCAFIHINGIGYNLNENFKLFGGGLKALTNYPKTYQLWKIESGEGALILDSDEILPLDGDKFRMIPPTC